MARNESGYVLSRDLETARAQILKAAQKVILRFGLAKTTMDDIAKEAGISRPTVYRHFQDRTQLVSALVDWRSRMVLDRTEKFLRERKSLDVSFSDLFIDGVIHVVASARRDPIAAAVLNPADQHGESWLQTLELAASLTQDLWGPIFAEAQENGAMRSDLADSELYIWLTLVQFSLFNRMEFVPPADPIHAQMLRTFVLPALLPNGVEIARANGKPATKNRVGRKSTVAQMDRSLPQQPS